LNGALRLKKPFLYQETDGVKTTVDGDLVVKGRHELGFLVGSYDPNIHLIIDPVLSYSTYLGRNGDDIGNGIVVDSTGNTYVTGSTTSTDFPTTAGVFQPSIGILGAAFITKLNPTGTALVYSTYLVGAGVDVANGLAVDTSGNAYVTGSTGSTNFPTTVVVFQPA